MKSIKIFFKGFLQGFKNFGYNISIIINSILLLAVYLIGVGITAIFAKIFRKKFLDMELSDDRKTYWSELNLEKKPTEEYYRQF